jgi:hypothetical protein
MKAEVRNRCCQDLRTYLETALAGARGGVISVKLGKVLEVSRAYVWKRQYAWCLSRLLRRYKFSEVYLLTRQQAEELLNGLDTLCAELAKKQEKKLKVPKQEEPAPTYTSASVADGERMPMVSFHIPRALLQALDEYARRMNLTRSDVIRIAIKQMLDKMRAAEEKEPECLVAV